MNLLRSLPLLLLCYFFSAQADTTFKEFTEKTVANPGYFNFYQDSQQGKIYLDIQQHLNKPFIFQSSLPSGIGSNDIGFDRGQLGETRLVQFERTGKKVFLRQLNSRFRANSSNMLEQRAVDEAFASSIIWGFEVHIEQDKHLVVEYTDFLLSDIHNISSYLSTIEQGSYAIDNSRSAIYPKRSKSFPNNTELEATVTYTGTEAGQYIVGVTPDPSAITVNLHHSLIKLPDNNYQTRAFHPFSGFWPKQYADYATAIDQPLVQRIIPRHRLNKKSPNAKSSEALEPIIYYLDPGVPEPMRSALIEGASWWNQAFEAIGYRNAFQVKVLPADADPMDARYNVIQWVHRATRGWSYGSTITDPRTGEIIKGHVTLGSLRVRQDYLIALGLTSPFNSTNTDTAAMKAMALARIRQLAAHEVGHTLGIAHNFSASANNRASVMDYPHPYIDIVNGELDLSNAYTTGIGEWDKHVIAYGYSDFSGSINNQESEQQALEQLIVDAKGKGLQHLSDEDARPGSAANTQSNLWDNGSSPAEELIRVLKVREIALENFGVNSLPHGSPLSELEQVLVPIYNFHRYQVKAAAKLIAGINYHYELREEKPIDGISAVSGAKQYQAINALIGTLQPKVLTLPEHIIKLIPPKAYGYNRDREHFTSNTGISFDPVSAAEASAKHTLTALLNPERLARLHQQSVIDKNIPTPSVLIDTLINSTIKSDAANNLGQLSQQRVNQQVVEHLLSLWHGKNTVAELRADVYFNLLNLSEWLSENSKKRHQKRPHFTQYLFLKMRIDYSLNNSEPFMPASTLELPPGSPI